MYKDSICKQMSECHSKTVTSVLGINISATNCMICWEIVNDATLKCLYFFSFFLRSSSPYFPQRQCLISRDGPLTFDEKSVFLLRLKCGILYYLTSVLLFLYYFTESQNSEGWKVGIFWSSLISTTLLKQVLEQVAQDCVQAGFECLWTKRLYIPSGKSIPVLSHS